YLHITQLSSSNTLYLILVISYFFFLLFFFFFFFFHDTATTEIYTLSLHDALPISAGMANIRVAGVQMHIGSQITEAQPFANGWRSEEHTSELQSLAYLVCRLLLEKKKKKKNTTIFLTSLNNLKNYTT